MNDVIKWEDIKNEEDAIQILDKGFVYLKSLYGTDSTICETARISYGKGTKSINDDRNLIRYLKRHKHTSPLEQCEVTFVLKLPLFVMSQIVRHRTSSINQYSGRYSVMLDEYYFPDEINYQATDNKQGRSEALPQDEYEKWIESYTQSLNSCRTQYQESLDKGISREQARMVLPASQYTLCVFKIDLHNMMHFLKLRMDKHAQKEVRDYADAMYKILHEKFPMAFEAFDEYELHAKNMSRTEMDILKECMSNFDPTKSSHFQNLSKREQTEFAEKLDLNKYVS